MRPLTLLALGTILIAGAVDAHHGSGGQFDHDVDVDVTGTVTKVRFVNPHAWIYFDVKGEDGDTQNWRCELRGGSILKRFGWTTDMFEPGTEITIHGSQARREVHGCYTRSVTFADGTTYQRNDVIDGTNVAKAQVATVELSADVPVLNGNWVAPPRTRGARPPGAPAAGGPGARPTGGPRPGGRPSPYKQTELGVAAGVGFHREMNPRFSCQATNIFHDWTFDQHVNKIEQTDEKIVLTYGFMDIVRTIHLDRDQHPANIEPSRAGHSIGKWEGDTLVVDTVGFEEGYLAATFTGVKHGDQMHVVERFSLSDDGNDLIQRYVVTDPEYLAAPFEGESTINKTDVAFDPYHCEDLTEEVVEGF